jgi:signal transduction histidine kinase
MDSQEKIALLQGIDLFRSFEADELARFAEAIEEFELPAEAVLCSEGAPGQDMFILLEGRLQIFKDKRAITTISPVDYIGEMAIIEEKPRSATVICSTPVKLLRITSAQFKQYLASQPRSLVSLMQTLSQRIRKDTKQLAQEYEKANILIHDMRNAMSVFLLLDVMAHDTLSPGEYRSYYSLLKKGRNDIAAMMDEALANAKQLQFPKELEVNSLPGLINDLTALLSRHPDLIDKRVIVEQAEPIPEFLFNRLDIGRAITNLVINAAQASPSSSTIRITLSIDSGQTVVAVSDHGVGIAKAIRSKIFLPQFTTKKNGCGLGLASCKEIIETMHGGTISVESDEGAGATFRFTLPLTHDQKKP